MLVFTMSLPVVTFLLTYAISLSMGLMQYPFYFLSVSIEAKPASCFGSFGLSLTCLVAPVLAFVRSKNVEKLALDVPDKVKSDRALLLNERALKCAILAGLGGHGVASFQSKSEVPECGDAKWIVGVHLLWAGLFFGCGCLYCFISHRIDRLVPDLGTPGERKARAMFAYGTVAQFFLLMFVLPGLYMAVGAGTNDDGTVDCSSGGCWVIVVMSGFEITLLVTFMSTYVTFLEEFRGMQLVLNVLHTDRAWSLHERDHSVMQQTAGVEIPGSAADVNYT
ncbi:hypothetical protein TeGR_g612 [Tetraparma gracilis]|uniref:CWH43-like N-terminal domain-containing protein n=1 Tax=Tetraparma gracilis TaxID=2962635 RepID=A0ABQ6MJD2_9STRA|nr:hypothetical protein TeGR_g612 [Tetraparma gracilis]